MWRFVRRHTDGEIVYQNNTPVGLLSAYEHAALFGVGGVWAKLIDLPDLKVFADRDGRLAIFVRKP